MRNLKRILVSLFFIFPAAALAQVESDAENAENKAAAEQAREKCLKSCLEDSVKKNLNSIHNQNIRSYITLKEPISLQAGEAIRVGERDDILLCRLLSLSAKPITIAKERVLDLIEVKSDEGAAMPFRAVYKANANAPYELHCSFKEETSAATIQTFLDARLKMTIDVTACASNCEVEIVRKPKSRAQKKMGHGGSVPADVKADGSQSAI